MTRYLKHYDEIDFNDSEEKSKFSEKYIKLTNAIKMMVISVQVTGYLKGIDR